MRNFLTMKGEINLKNQKVEYELRRSKRARHMRLAVYCGGSLVVTAPENLNFSKIENFILKKAEWVLEKIGIMAKRKKSRVFFGSSQREYKKLKNQALALAKIKVEKFNAAYGFQYNKISIRNQKTRWGSCSKKGNLNYNYKIIHLPEDLADYIIVHELCHLKEFNHSKNFWDLVSIAVPDCRERRKKIRNI
jgi:predicted metal-dependent hydrolase